MDVFELHHRDTNKSIVSPEAVILNANVELVRSNLILIPNDAARKDPSGSLLQQKKQKDLLNLQVKNLIVLWRPVGVLVLGSLLPLLVCQMRADKVNFDKWLERLDLWPLEIVGSDN